MPSGVLPHLANIFDLKEPEGNQTIGDDTAPVRCVDKASEVIPTGSTGVGIELKKNPKKASGHSPMDWNPTAQTSKVI